MMCGHCNRQPMTAAILRGAHLGGESERAFLNYFTLVSRKHMAFSIWGL